MEQNSSLDCDVIIVNYNAGGVLTECVKSALAEQVRNVFVVDNDSHVVYDNYWVLVRVD